MVDERPYDARREARRRFIRDVAVNVLGTLIAGLILFLGGVVLGAFKDVPTASIVGAVGALASFAIAALSVRRAALDVADRVRITDRVLRPQKRTMAALKEAERKLSAGRLEISRLIDQAQAAIDAEDADEAARLLAEIELLWISMKAAADEARERLVAFDVVADTEGIDEWLRGAREFDRKRRESDPPDEGA